MKLITELQNGNKVVQAKVFLVLFTIAVIVGIVLQLAGIVKL